MCHKPVKMSSEVSSTGSELIRIKSRPDARGGNPTTLCRAPDRLGTDIVAYVVIAEDDNCSGSIGRRGRVACKQCAEKQQQAFHWLPQVIPVLSAVRCSLLPS